MNSPENFVNSLNSINFDFSCPEIPQADSKIPNAGYLGLSALSPPNYRCTLEFSQLCCVGAVLMLSMCEFLLPATCEFNDGITIDDVFAGICEDIFLDCMTLDACSHVLESDFCDFPNDAMAGPEFCWVGNFGFSQGTEAFFAFSLLIECVQDACGMVG